MYAERRQRVLDEMGPGAMLIPAAPTAIRNNDVEHDYRQDSDLYYLTGFEEPHAVLLLTNVHEEHRSVLFLQPRDPEREVWDGPRLGEERAPEALGVDAAFPIAELDEKLAGYLANAERLHVRLGTNRAMDQRIFRTVQSLRRKERSGSTAPREYVDPSAVLHEHRLKKAPTEIETMRRAMQITGEAHLAAMKAAAPGKHEYEVEAELLRVFRGSGSGRPAYGSIVGSGPNATVLHYRSNDRRLEEGDLLLIDAGCEYGYYASDVTRTFPVSGSFSKPQRALYEVVLEAQQRAIAAVKPGATMEDVHQVALHAVVDGLLALGLVEGDRDGVIEEKTYRPFFMHRTGHWLGMDVHDVGAYYVEGKPRPLEPGMVLTVEPGIYVSPTAEVDEPFRGIGIRIEDDVLVTPEGQENLTATIPKTPSDLEAILGAR